MLAFQFNPELLKERPAVRVRQEVDRQAGRHFQLDRVETRRDGGLFLWEHGPDNMHKSLGVFFAGTLIGIYMQWTCVISHSLSGTVNSLLVNDTEECL